MVRRTTSVDEVLLVPRANESIVWVRLDRVELIGVRRGSNDGPCRVNGCNAGNAALDRRAANLKAIKDLFVSRARAC